MSTGARVLLGVALSAGIAGVCAAVATGHLRFPGDEPGALASVPDASLLRGDPIAGVAARPAADAAPASVAAVPAGPVAVESKGALVAPPPAPPAAPAAGPSPAETAPAASPAPPATPPPATPTSATPPPAAPTPATDAPGDQPVAPTAAKRPVDGDGYVALSFAELSDFQFWAPDPYGTPEEIRAAMERLQQIPEDIRALDGKRVSVRGTMSPIDVDRRGVKRFMLVAYQTGCCFGMAIRLNEQIMVSMPGDERAEYVVYDDITVSGTLQVGAQFEDGWVTSLYRMVADEVVVEDG